MYVETNLDNDTGILLHSNDTTSCTRSYSIEGLSDIVKCQGSCYVLS